MVKLTPDLEDEAQSAMQVVAANQEFYYGSNAGAAGCFLAGLFHKSVVPRSAREHLKMAFFFRRSMVRARVE